LDWIMDDDARKWAAHFRERAAESAKRADDAIDPTIEAYHRSLVGRYLKLAEAEETAADRRQARSS
jgi:hypothetical protein